MSSSSTGRGVRAFIITFLPIQGKAKLPSKEVLELRLTISLKDEDMLLFVESNCRP